MSPTFVLVVPRHPRAIIQGMVLARAQALTQTIEEETTEEPTVQAITA